MEELVLNNRKIKLVDGEIWSFMDYKLNPCWRKIKYTITNEGYYSFNLTHNYKQKHYSVHRVIYKFNNPDWDIHDVSSDNEIDHIDNCKTNNNIENLRVVNHSENRQNTLSTKGYCLDISRNKYRANITINKKRYFLGHYDTAEEARDAYLIGKEKYHTH